MNLSASIAVRRIVKGDTLSLYFEQTGKPLFQGFNPETGVAVPSWTSATGDHPIVTPKVGSARGASVTLTNHVWEYNGNDLKFSKSGSGWETSSVDSRFQMNHSDGSLAIIGNLASKENEDVDTLNYSGDAISGTSTYPLTHTIDISICPLGSSSFGGGVTATSAIIGSVNGTTIEKTTLSTFLYNANGTVTDYTVAWKKGSAAFGTGQTISVSRDDVDSHQLFIAEFSYDGAVVFRAGISITDISDQYQLQLYHAGTTQGVDESHSDTIKGKIINVTTSEEVTPSSSSWSWKVYKTSDYSVVKSATDSSITITDSDTKDSSGNVFDVTVNGEVTFSL